MYELIASVLSSSALWGAASATGVVVLQKIFSSPREKKTDKREDFKAITDSLFKEVSALREEASHCDRNYQELQSKFIEFKSKYSELELRYQIQVNINKKISEEIKRLEMQLESYLDNEQKVLDDNKNTTTGNSTETPTGE
jgi:predicted nuclease with TOPRIM domain